MINKFLNNKSPNEESFVIFYNREHINKYVGKELFYFMIQHTANTLQGKNDKKFFNKIKNANLFLFEVSEIKTETFIFENFDLLPNDLPCMFYFKQNEIVGFADKLVYYENN